MKRILSIVLAVIIVVMALSFSGCGQQTGSEQKSLYIHGEELIEVLQEMAQSEEYLSVYTGSTKIGEIVTEIGSGDFSEIKAVYAVNFDAKYISEFASFGQDKMSDALKKTVENKAVAAIISQVNAMAGVESLAATSVCTTGKTFVSTEITDTVIYIYTFNDAVPVAVTFTTGEDNTVSATATFVVYDEFSCNSSQEIADFFGGVGITVEEINQ